MRTAVLVSTTMAALVAVGSHAAIALGQDCDVGWTQNLFPLAGVDGEVYATLTWDDGTGPAVYIGGEFTIAGSVNASNIARWDGERWEALGSGAGGVVRSLGIFDDGAGEALYVGGEFLSAGGLGASNIARWDGSQWSALDDGVGGPVLAMTADNGRLYVGGEFGTASGVPARNLAWWDGDSWSGPPNGTGAPILALQVHDDGSGERLFVGGEFIGVGGGVSARGIASWDPATQVWSAVGGGVSGAVNAMELFDDGAGPDLYVGGSFTMAGGLPMQGVARWDGGVWSPLAGGLDGGVRDLLALDGDAGPMLVAVGPFTRAGGEFFGNGVSSWNGSAWSAVGFGLPVFRERTPFTITAFDSVSGARLVAGGNLPGSNGVGVFSGDSWQTIGGDRPTVLLQDSLPLTAIDLGDGSQLYFAGNFDLGPTTHFGVARWDGSSIEVLDGGVEIDALPDGLIGFDDGSGAGVYGSGFGDLADAIPVMRWDGSGWQPVGDPPLLNSRGALHVFDDGDGPALYVGGRSLTAGGQVLGGLARWDGQTWSAVGDGLADSEITAFETFDDGRGLAMYVAGAFTEIGGIPAQLVARWDGSNWENVGGGLSGRSPDDMAVFDSGTGPELILLGQIFFAEGEPAGNIARWNGSRWAPLSGTGVSLPTDILQVFDSGAGPELYAAGAFDSAGGAIASNIAKWNGLVWSDVDGGLDGAPRSIVVFDGGLGPALFVGGSFTRAGGVPSIEIARYGCNPTDCPADLDGDGLLTFFDFLTFQNLFDAGDLAADFDGDGSLTLFDFLAFQNEFDAGC